MKQNIAHTVLTEFVVCKTTRKSPPPKLTNHRHLSPNGKEANFRGDLHGQSVRYATNKVKNPTTNHNHAVNTFSSNHGIPPAMYVGPQ